MPRLEDSETHTNKLATFRPLGYPSKVIDALRILKEEYDTRFEGLCAALLDKPTHFGYCYRRLTDVYQEENDIYRFNRREKFDLEGIWAAQARPVAIEQHTQDTAS